MAIRENDPQKLQDWMVQTEKRLRMLENRRLEAGSGLVQDHATKTMGAKISEDPGNSATIGDDGGIKATDTVTTADEHNPLWIQQYMTSGTGQSIANNTDVLITWQATYSSGVWTSDANTITIPADGFYGVAIDWGWANNTAGNRVVHMTINTTTVTAFSSMVATSWPGGGESQTTMTDFRLFTKGDILRCYAFQNSGVALNGGSVYFGDIRGRWTVWKMGDSFPPALTQSTA